MKFMRPGALRRDSCLGLPVANTARFDVRVDPLLMLGRK